MRISSALTYLGEGLLKEEEEELDDLAMTLLICYFPPTQTIDGYIVPYETMH